MGPLFPPSRGGPLRRIGDGFLIAVVIAAIIAHESGKKITRTRYGGRVAAVVFFVLLFGLLFWLFPPARL